MTNPEKMTPEEVLHSEIRRLDQRDDQLALQMAEGFRSVTARLDQLGQEMRSSRSPNYTAIGVLLTAIFGIGAALWWPIQGDINELKHHAEKDGHPETFMQRIETIDQVINDREQTRRYYQEQLDQQRLAHQAQIDRHQNERIDRIDYYGSAHWQLGEQAAPNAPHPESR